jgi:hypothetical protein
MIPEVKVGLTMKEKQAVTEQVRGRYLKASKKKRRLF